VARWPVALGAWLVRMAGWRGRRAERTPAGSTYAGAVETRMHTYLHCPLAALRAPSPKPRARLLRAVDAWRAARASDALGVAVSGTLLFAAGEEPAAAPSRPEALRWVHSDSALVEGRLVGAGAVQLTGGVLRLAAYEFHREAVKARRVRGAWHQWFNIRSSGGAQLRTLAPGPPGVLWSIFTPHSGAPGDVRCTWEAHNLNQGAPQLPIYAAGAPRNDRCALEIASAPQRHRCTCRSAGVAAG
jgi:hypothetical protein